MSARNSGRAGTQTQCACLWPAHQAGRIFISHGARAPAKLLPTQLGSSSLAGKLVDWLASWPAQKWFSFSVFAGRNDDLLNDLNAAARFDPAGLSQPTSSPFNLRWQVLCYLDAARAPPRRLAGRKRDNANAPHAAR